MPRTKKQPAGAKHTADAGKPPLKQQKAGRGGVPSVARDAITATPEPVPKLPHERDQSTDDQRSPPDEVIRRGHHDIERGVQDTSRAAETDRAYHKLRKR